jgi:hypothetical protein
VGVEAWGVGKQGREDLFLETSIIAERDAAHGVKGSKVNGRRKCDISDRRRLSSGATIARQKQSAVVSTGVAGDYRPALMCGGSQKSVHGA